MSTDSYSRATAAEQYTVRPYDSADLDGFLRLDRLVWDRRRGPEWFRWKYVDNPYTDDIPVFVAEHDGKIVGARPFLAVRLRIGDQSISAYQPADTMVHPDHRREGIFQQMTTHALSAYQDREPALFFNFPNQHARPGYLDLGWREVAPEITYYRIETPTAIRSGSELSQTAVGALSPFVKGYYTARQALSTAPEELWVRQVDGTAIEQLTALHSRRHPPTIHAERTETFLQWRLSSPVWERRTYFIYDASPTEQPIAAIVARSRETSEGFRLTQVVDVAPLCGGLRWQQALWKGLEEIVTTHPETDLFAISDGAIPHKILTTLGFLPDDSLPLSRFATFDSTLVVRPNGDPTDEMAWQIAGQPVDDHHNWCVTFAERDTT